MTATRGTTNRNARGSAEDRRRRRQYLLSTFGDGTTCPCYRCGIELTDATITVDRIKPGKASGRYVRSNIRPACGPCNSETGGALAGIRVCIGCGRGPLLSGRSKQQGLKHEGRGLCRVCYNHAKWSGVLVNYPRSTRSRDDLCADLELLTREGYSRTQIADRLGMSRSALDRAISRLRAAERQDQAVTS
jgi:hypothetical protein